MFEIFIKLTFLLYFFVQFINQEVQDYLNGRPKDKTTIRREMVEVSSAGVREIDQQEICQKILSKFPIFVL